MLDATNSMAQYKGNGAQSVFPIPFPFQEAAHIHAHVSEGMATRRLAPGVDFTVTVHNGGGELVLSGDTLAAGRLLTIRRLLPLTQEILFHNQGPNSPQAIEEAVDKLTMISQQLQASVEICVQAPDSETAAELADSAAANASRVAAVEQSLSAKADSAALADKADRSELSAKADASQLALKADKTALAGKADSVHSHGMGAVDGLSAALAAKLDADDPRLDPIGSGGTADHAELENRDAADQHPQSAITNLTADLSAIRAGLSEQEESGEELFDHVETLAGRTDELSARADALGGRMGAVESGVAALDSELGGVGETVEAQGEEIAALDGRVTATETTTAGIQTEVTEVQTEVSEAESSLVAVATLLERITERLVTLEENSGGSGGGTPPETGGGGIIGDIRLLPFRPEELPFGWHFCDGAALLFSSAAGQALAGLPTAYKRDWGIENVDGAVTLPNLFDRETGAGLFPRAVDGFDRLPGSVQGDAIRNITGSYSVSKTAGVAVVIPADNSESALSGALTTQRDAPPKQYSLTPLNYGPNRIGDLLFDASLVVPTAGENRPLNIGMTPAIYLGA